MIFLKFIHQEIINILAYGEDINGRREFSIVIKDLKKK